MARRDDRARSSPDRNSRRLSSAGPPLALVGAPIDAYADGDTDDSAYEHPLIDGPVLDSLVPDDALYATACWTHHHARYLPANARAGLMISLYCAWPAARGRPRTAGKATIQAAWLAEHGVSVEAIAAKFHVDIDVARRRIATGRAHYHSVALFPKPALWRVIATLAGEVPDPCDPSVAFRLTQAAPLAASVKLTEQAESLLSEHHAR